MRRRRRGRRGKGAEIADPVSAADGCFAPELQTEQAFARRQGAQVPRRLDEFRLRQIDFFHRTRAAAMLAGERNIREHVRREWKETFGTELTVARYEYLAHDPEHAAQRKASLERVLQDVPHLLAQCPLTQVGMSIERAWSMFEDVRADPNMLRVMGSSVPRARDDATGAWRDTPVIHTEPPERVLIAMVGLIKSLEEGRMRLAIEMVRAGSQGAAAGAVAGAHATGGTAQMNVFVGKASSIVTTPGDDVVRKQHYTQEEADLLISQENTPFGIPEDTSISYEEHVRHMRAADEQWFARQAAGPSSPPIDDGAASAEDARAAWQRELDRGVVFDEDAVRDADAAARSIPPSRSLT